MTTAPKSPVPWLTFWRWNVAFVVFALVTNGNWFARPNNEIPLTSMFIVVVWLPFLVASILTGLKALYFTPRPLAMWRNTFVPVFATSVLVAWGAGWWLALRLPALQGRGRGAGRSMPLIKRWSPSSAIALGANRFQIAQGTRGGAALNLSCQSRNNCRIADNEVVNTHGSSADDSLAESPGARQSLPTAKYSSTKA